MEKIILKPNKTSFFITRTITLFLLLFLFLIVPTIWFSIFLNFWEIDRNNLKDFIEFWTFWKYIPIFLFFSLLWIYYFWLSFIYKKEEYIISNNKIIYNYWGIFSDNSVELNIDKITEVTMVLPFLENLFFKTWRLSIKTAWSVISKTNFFNLKEVEKIYEKVQEVMRLNWFHLQKDKLVQEAKPHPLWVLFEVWWRIIYWTFVFFIIFFDEVFLIKNEIENISNYYLYIIIFWLIISFSIISIFVLNYLDLKRRKYDVYTDSIFYTNWFLTKVYSFLPMEKVSDVENRQGFFSKIFWLHDVIISSEWTNNQVIFLNMVNWESLIKNIKYLKNAITLTEKENIEDTYKVDEVIWFVDKTDTSFDYNKDFSGQYKMNLARVMFWSIFWWLSLAIFVSIIFWWIQLFFPILILSIIFSFVKWFINVKFNTYIVEKNTIESKYEFLTNNHKTFTIDKITWVVFKENLIDKIFKTCSIYFSSIGSSWLIIFKDIKKTKNLENDILTKIWMYKSEESETLKVSFNLKNFILSEIWYSIFLLVIWIIISIFWFNIFFSIQETADKQLFVYVILSIFSVIFIIFPALSYIYYKIALSQRFYINKIYKNFYEAKEWIIFQTKKYSLLKNIKWVVSKKYPFTNTWDLYLDIAWDIVIEDNKNKIPLWGMKISWKYLDNIYLLQNKLDSLLIWQEISEEILEKSEQSIFNSIFFQIIIFFVLIFSVLILNSWRIDISQNDIFTIKIILYFFLTISFLSLLISIWYIRSKYYFLQKQRVMVWYGIIYKSRKTISYDRINFVEKNQWFLWKIFWNWIVQIYTIWSWFVDLVLNDTKDFMLLYDKLKK